MEIIDVGSEKSPPLTPVRGSPGVEGSSSVGSPTNAGKLSFSISRLLGDKPTSSAAATVSEESRSDDGHYTMVGFRKVDLSPIPVTNMYPGGLHPAALSLYDPLYSGAHGTVIRVPAHRPAATAMGAPASMPPFSAAAAAAAAAAFPWMASRSIALSMKDRMQGKPVLNFFFNISAIIFLVVHSIRRSNDIFFTSQLKVLSFTFC